MRISVEQAIELLKSGNVVSIPTETVYGLAAALSCPSAIADIFALKGRPSNNPLIVHLAQAKQITAYAEHLPENFLKLAAAFWPGPLTIVLPVLLNHVPDAARAGLATAAFRVPYHALARAVIEKTGPLVMPSANLSGRPSSTCAQHVESDFGDHFPVLDGGECTSGMESTILYWDKTKAAWVIIRLGALAPEAFLTVLGYSPVVINGPAKGVQHPICPGQMFRHYAPKSHLKLVSVFPSNASGVIVGFDDRMYPKGCRLISLGSSHHPQMAAQRLYAVLRRLDQEFIESAWVDIDLPDEGLWLTLKERLRKAAQ